MLNLCIRKDYQRSISKASLRAVQQVQSDWTKLKNAESLGSGVLTVSQVTVSLSWASNHLSHQNQQRQLNGQGRGHRTPVTSYSYQVVNPKGCWKLTPRLRPHHHVGSAASDSLEVVGGTIGNCIHVCLVSRKRFFEAAKGHHRDHQLETKCFFWYLPMSRWYTFRFAGVTWSKSCHSIYSKSSWGMVTAWTWYDLLAYKLFLW